MTGTESGLEFTQLAGLLKGLLGFTCILGYGKEYDLLNLVL